MQISIKRIGHHGDCFSLTTTQTIWKNKKLQEVSQNIEISANILNTLTLDDIYNGLPTFRDSYRFPSELEEYKYKKSLEDD